MPKARAIVVGAGGISGAWFEALKKEKVEVPAVVDLNQSAAEEKIEQFELSALASDDLKKTLRDTAAEFVVDCTVPQAHCGVTCAALQTSFHVVGEKPMASSMTEARKMVRTAEQTGQMFMVSQSRRWESRHDVLARTVKSGKIGNLTTVSCDFYLGAHFERFRIKMPSPLILDMAIHHFDLARMISGCNPVSVYAEEFNPTGSWYAGAAAANCLFEMTGGVKFAYRGSWCAEGCTTGWAGNWRLIGDRGSILYENEKDPHGQVVAGQTGFTRPVKNIKFPRSSLKFVTQHGALREMLQFLRTGRIPQTQCHDNIHSLAMVFAAIDSARKGKGVPVKI